MYDVLVVGSNLIGATAALALEQAGARVALLDRNPRATDSFSGEDYDPRVIAVAPDTQSFWQRLGVWSLVEQQRVCSYDQMHVWDTQSIHFDALTQGVDQLGHIVEQSVVLEALHQLIDESSVQRLPNDSVVHVERGNDRVDAIVSTSSGDHIRAKLVVAADGVNSSIRSMLGIKASVTDYHQQGIVATISCDRSHQYTAWQRFLPTGPLALLPLGGNNDQYLSIVYSVDSAIADDKMTMSDAQWCAELSEVSQGVVGNITSISKRFSFPLRKVLTSSYYSGNIALVGDAAHGIHPLAGLGANLGVADVAALMRVIERQLKSGESIAAELALSDYALSRSSANKLVAHAMGGFYHLFGSEDPWIKMVRNEGMAIVDRFESLKKFAVKGAAGTSI